MPGRQIDQLFYTITARTGGFTKGLGTAQRSMRGFLGKLTPLTVGLAGEGERRESNPRPPGPQSPETRQPATASLVLQRLTRSGVSQHPPASAPFVTASVTAGRR